MTRSIFLVKEIFNNDTVSYLAITRLRFKWLNKLPQPTLRLIKVGFNLLWLGLNSDPTMMNRVQHFGSFI